MKRKNSLMVVGMLGVALALTACGDDSDSGDDSGDDGSSGRARARSA